jgi:hypothetical protein
VDEDGFIVMKASLRPPTINWKKRVKATKTWTLKQNLPCGLILNQKEKSMKLNGKQVFRGTWNMLDVV